VRSGVRDGDGLRVDVTCVDGTHCAAVLVAIDRISNRNIAQLSIAIRRLRVVTLLALDRGERFRLMSIVPDDLSPMPNQDAHG
jgi:hypothetical protein